MYISYLCEVAHDVYYQRLIKNLFVSIITNKGKVAYIRPLKPNLRWQPLNDIEVI